ncbi:hypothetical protein PG994_002866 [Apiospora phragmitis]|uniref:Cyanovirin-N domain-containing protein n=1 Tax=Apiospora phragmitis TaxID=2905665 RepID=A0ABR1W6D8_9PEZI
MKMLIQFFAMLALLVCVFADDFPQYADPGQCETIQGKQRQLTSLSIKQWSSYSVIANCPKPDGTYQCSILDLDKCYANAAGAITPRENGDFSSSCNDCYWTNTVLHCNCDINPGNSFMQPQIETNLLLVNAKGFVQCFDRVADKCPPGVAPAGSPLLLRPMKRDGRRRRPFRPNSGWIQATTQKRSRLTSNITTDDGSGMMRGNRIPAFEKAHPDIAAEVKRRLVGSAGKIACCKYRISALACLWWILRAPGPHMQVPGYLLGQAPGVRSALLLKKFYIADQDGEEAPASAYPNPKENVSWPSSSDLLDWGVLQRPSSTRSWTGGNAAPAQAVGAVGEPDDPLVNLGAAPGAQPPGLVHVGPDVDEAGRGGETADVVQVGLHHHHHRRRQEAGEESELRPHGVYACASWNQDSNALDTALVGYIESRSGIASLS